ncbi:magnesium transporter CorA family protein [Lichenihabitans psoromatis]|uniref:magnesium transporter CorA family protein n=1 Tax=Lichenihabitans psoromatis TaxID=2528642 RepID=UPI001036DDD3|nr:magnesium transporter CorA family protein [Lichenihabitans psoromatis]
MLKFYDNVGARDEVTCDLTLPDLPSNVVWMDLLDPTAEELSFVERFAKVILPDDESLEDLQTVSRLRFEGDILQVFTPVLFRDPAGEVRTTTVGFFLTPKLLVTVRTEELLSFTNYINRKVKPGDATVHVATDVFVGLLEAIVDRMADAVEALGAELDRVSRQIFTNPADSPKRIKPIKYEAELESILHTVGRSGDLTSNIRDSLLGIGRLLAFVTANAQDKLPNGVKNRIKTLRQDIASLNDYETRLTDKVQFLLDSTLGFINIDQNRLFRLLTIASVVGIPPTFVVGLYGMNFKNMPEYDWAWGYQWGLLLVSISMVVPAIWLRRKGWF